MKRSVLGRLLIFTAVLLAVAALSACGENDEDKCEHSEQIIEAIPATCEDMGKSEGIKCSLCAEILVEPEDVDRLPHIYNSIGRCSVCGSGCIHSEEPIAAKEPSCTEAGSTAGSRCSNCGRVSISPSPIDKIAHSYGTDDKCTVCGADKIACTHENKEIPAIPATCTTPGKTAGVKCALCFEILKAQTDIAPKLHRVGADDKCIDCKSNITYSTNLEFESINGGAEYSVYAIGSAAENNIYIPSLYNGKPVTAISDYAFQDNENINGVMIPASVKRIGTYAFDGCSKLRFITLSEGLEEIGAYALRGTYITSISVPATVIKMGSDSLASYSLEELRLEDETLCSVYVPYLTHLVYSMSSIISEERGVTYVGPYAAYATSTVTSVTLKDGTLAIGPKAFDGCDSLQTVRLPSGLTCIGVNAFRYCYNLNAVEMPSSLKRIAQRAFFGTGLDAITLPASLEYIGDYAFSESSLPIVMVPAGIEFGMAIFMNCLQLERAYFDDGTEKITTSMFSGCRKLASVGLPGTIHTIEDLAFRDCTGLTSITVPESVITMGGGVFSGCKNIFIYLQVASIPDGWSSGWSGDIESYRIQWPSWA